MTTHQLDARRLLCPMPVIRTETKVAELASGDRLEVLCTDRGALHDIPAWCRVNGHRFVEAATDKKTGVISIVLEVGK